MTSFFLTSSVAAVLFFAICITISRLAKPRSSSSQLPLPPGPRDHPLIGHLLSPHRARDYLYWNSLSEQYGPISSLRMGPHLLIIVNSHAAARARPWSSCWTSRRPGRAGSS
ncbi:hypothetical protein F4778DRAFT_125096 [Xylariomycetidae sp. FL2044]|nr:hypothetical protein F4778DRAFT_125096 [Xylariomycetidae sp. FL2044]